ncbi:hypothetical protein P280DRAFT_528966 [Massarina eburnea CBS 473.64]|uniref:Uncharacterized protein n=1 Tax=Massarina eburnea CBS 473.64 TaxID=1395130 RepID=A0A6A6RUC8_9PLEO|nr:hypothetical protein P280DRAFT_528966 [Massarina eburnea CBS 473.64]
MDAAMDVLATLTPYLQTLSHYLAIATKHANPPNNVLGLILFVAYIAAAIYATTAISLSLWRGYTRISLPQTATGKDDHKRIQDVQRARKRHIKIYAFLASVSFASLTYHMGLFLVESYAAWVAGKIGVKTVSVEDAWKTADLQRVKGWVLESALFEGFARELVGDGPSAVWSMGAVVGGWFWGVWMVQKVNARGFSTKEMLPYILLTQTLPISLTITLFIIKLHLASPDLSNNPPSPPPPSSKPLSRKPTSLTLPTILLNISLLSLPSLRNTPYFLPLVLVIRIVLLSPWSRRVSLKDDQVVQSIAISGGFVMAQVFLLRKVSPGGVGELVRGVWNGGEAVRAMGVDALVGVAVHLVLGWGGGV